MDTHKIAPFASLPDQAEGLPLLGATIRIRARQNGGQYYLFESLFSPGDANRLHRHETDDEIVYVLSGRLTIRLDNRTIEAPAGSVAHLPKGIPHALSNPHRSQCDLLTMAIPGIDLEEYFDELHAALTENATLGRDAINQIARKHRLEWLE